jgi:hypothetical protein
MSGGWGWGWGWDFVGGSSWWDPNGEGLSVWAAYEPKGAASLAASYTDMSGNGNDAGVGVAPTWDTTNGWKFNGSTQYLTTAFAAQNDQSQSILIQYTNWSSTTSNDYLAGSQDGSNRWFGVFGHSGNDVISYVNGQVVSVAPFLPAGNLGVAGSQGYRNGAAEGGAMGAWGGAAGSAVYIGCRNNSSTPDLFSAHYCQALAIYDSVLTAPQMLAIATRMAAL